MRLLLSIAIAFLPLVTFGQIPFSLQDRAFLQSTSPLRKDLAGYWRLEESSGTRYDFSKNGNHLSVSNAVTGAAGKVGNCAKFLTASSQSLFAPSSASLQTGDVNWTIALWANLTNITANHQLVIKGTAVAGSREYNISYGLASQRFRAFVYRPTDSAVEVKADALGVPTANTWYFVLVWHDSSADTVNIQINNGATNSTATGGALQAASTANFEIGESFGGNFLGGNIDECGIWKRLLTENEKATLYKSGAGNHFPWSASYTTPPPFLTTTDGEINKAHFSWQTEGIITRSGKTFNFYMSRNYNEVVSTLNHSGGPWSSSSVVGSVHSEDFNHSYISASIDSSGYFYTFYGCHDTPVYYRKSTNPYDATSWSSETSVDSSATYPQTFVDQSDNVYLFFRRSTNICRMLKSSNGGASFGTSLDIVSLGSTTNWSYISPGAIGRETPQNSLHMMFFQANITGDPETSTNIFYAKSLDGGATWRKADGTAYTLPADFSTLELVHSSNRVNGDGIGIDTNGYPHLLFIKANAGPASERFNNSTSWLSSWNGSAWSTQQLPGDNYYWHGRIVIDLNNTFWVFASQAQSGRREIIQMKSTNGGSSWSSSNITAGSFSDQENPVANIWPDGSAIDLTWDSDGGIYYLKIST